MISRAASRTSSERSSSTSPRPSISAFSFSRVRSDAGILSIGVLLRGGRSPNRTSLVRLIGRGSTPTLFPANLGLHPRRHIDDPLSAVLPHLDNRKLDLNDLAPRMFSWYAAVFAPFPGY